MDLICSSFAESITTHYTSLRDLELSVDFGADANNLSKLFEICAPILEVLVLELYILKQEDIVVLANCTALRRLEITLWFTAVTISLVPLWKSAGCTLHHVTVLAKNQNSEGHPTYCSYSSIDLPVLGEECKELELCSLVGLQIPEYETFLKVFKQHGSRLQAVEIGHADEFSETEVLALRDACPQADIDFRRGPRFRTPWKFFNSKRH